MTNLSEIIPDNTPIYKEQPTPGLIILQNPLPNPTPYYTIYKENPKTHPEFHLWGLGGQLFFPYKVHVNKELRKRIKKGVEKALKSKKKCYFCTRIQAQVHRQTETQATRDHINGKPFNHGAYATLAKRSG